jgi:hypothetical protein
MGAAKFPEEIVERYIEDSHAAEHLRNVEYSTPVAPRPILKYCPLCYEGYIEDAALDNHIASRHGKQHVFLKLNNQVVRDICWLKGPVRECTLVVLKVPQVEVGLTIHGRTKRLSITESTDLLEHLPGGSLDGAIGIEVRNGHLSRSFTIYHGKQPTFRSYRIDGSFARLMKGPLPDERVDLTAFRDGCVRHRLNELEVRYLDGIVEYCHGLNLEHERKRDLARSRLESSMDLLIPFRTPLAEELRHALALRMNCFLGQWGCSGGSPLRIAEHFFCKDQSDLGPPGDPPQAGRVEIPIDPVSRTILDALNAYHEEDDGAVSHLLSLIEVRDRNDEDKVALIDARMRARRGDHHGAMAAYERFRAHPIFGEEADNYLKVRGQI